VPARGDSLMTDLMNNVKLVPDSVPLVQILLPVILVYFPLKQELETIAIVLVVFTTMAAITNASNVTPYVNHVLMEVPVIAVELQIL